MIQSNEIPQVSLARHALGGHSFDELSQMAEAVAKGGLFGCRTKEAALTLMMLAQAEGLHPIQAMRQFHIIEGRPTLRSDAMQAKFQQAGGRLQWLKRTDSEVSAEFWHPTIHPDHLLVAWNDERCQQAGLFRDKPGNHEKYPLQMKAARCISEGVRAVLPEIVVGLYTPEEMQGIEEPSPRRRVDAQVREVTQESAAQPGDGLADDETFFGLWDQAVLERGVNTATGRNFIKALMSKKKHAELSATPAWRTDALQSLKAGKFDEVMLKKDKPPATEEAKPNGLVAAGEKIAAEARIATPQETANTSPAQTDAPKPPAPAPSAPAADDGPTEADFADYGTFEACMCEVTPNHTLDELTVAMQRYARVVVTTRAPGKTALECMTPATRMRMYKAACEGRFQIPTGKILTPQEKAEGVA